MMSRGREAVVRVLLVEVERALVKLERADAARVHDLDGERLRGLHRPADVVLDEGHALLLGERTQEEVVIAEHDERALVDDRRVAHLEVRLACVGGQHRGFEGGGVAHLGVAIAGGHGRGHRVAAAGTRKIGARDFLAEVILRHQHAADGDLAAADVGMRVDSAGHDHRAIERIFLVDLFGAAGAQQRFCRRARRCRLIWPLTPFAGS